MPDPNAPSNQIMVDTLIDIIDSGDGLTSLREALAIAADNDEIVFDTSLADGTILLNGAELVIDKSLTINGNTDNDNSTRNITIDGQGNSRIFKIDDGENTTTSEVSLLGLTLKNGFANNNGQNNNDGGAIWTLESLSISDSTIADNTASDDGGGIRNDGTLIINSSELNNNTSFGTSSTSGGGGLINTIGGSLTITATTLSGNTAQNGGGIRNDGTLTLKSSTLTANSATGEYGGGALVNTFNPGIASGTAQIINTTISGNSATFNGGGIAVAAGTVTLRNSTLIQNTAAVTGGGIGTAGTVNLYNTILAGNSAATGADAHTDNVSLFGLIGVINGDGNNLVGDVSDLGNGTLGSGTDLSLANQGLTLKQVLRTTLTSNGGPTQTHTLSAKSIAIDGGNNALALDESAAPLTSDQRGSDYARQIGTVDIGAIEYGSAGTTTDDILSGSQGNDYLFSDKGNDTLSGLGGNDRLRGGRGADNLDGGEGVDSVDYRGSNLGVTVNLSDNTASGGDAEGDTIINFERIYGSNFNDVLTGSDENNLLVGANGEDTLFGLDGNDRLRGGEGADNLDGGEGTADGVDYRGSDLGVTVNLSDNTASGGDAEGDTIINFERIYGSDFDDVLTGSHERNVLVGFDGNDTLSGLSGNDRLRGGQGADTLEGGLGRDTFEFSELTDSLLVNHDTIVDLSIGLDKIRGLSAVAAGNISELSAVSSLDESGISAVLDTTSFTSAGAAVFTFGSGNNAQTFLALNNDVSGFQAATDSIIEITGFSGSVSNLAIG